jgi:hypothetical protein
MSVSIIADQSTLPCDAHHGGQPKFSVNMMLPLQGGQGGLMSATTHVLAASSQTCGLQPVADASWPILCKCLTGNFRGMTVTVECVDAEGGRTVAVRDQFLEDVVFRVLQDGVPAVSVTTGTRLQRHVLDLTAPQALTVQRNAAGWPVRVEIDHAHGRAILHFNAEEPKLPKFSSNFWGE